MKEWRKWMANKGLLMKSYLGNNVRFADFVNSGLFKGEKKLIVQSLFDAGAEMVIKEKGIAPKHQARYRDILKQGIIKSDGKRIYCLFGVKSQSSVDNMMPLRVLEYDVLS